MIEEKLKKAVQGLPVPQSTFKSIMERAEQKPKLKCLWEKISRQIVHSTM